MAGKKSVIETGVDKLVKLVSERKRISVKDAARELGVSVGSIEDWADFLEEEDIIGVETKFATVYLVEKKIDKKDVLQKVKAVREQKEVLSRRIESSINALQRDSQEIKLIDSEFQQIKALFQQNFKSLTAKLGQLQDYRSSHREVEEKQREFEKEYGKRLAELDGKLQAEQQGYQQVIKQVTDQMTNLQKEKQEIEQMKASEKEMVSKMSEINTFLAKVKYEIDNKNKQLVVDEERLKRSEQNAQRIKEEIIVGSKALEQFRKEMLKSRAELETMEKAFLKDMEFITSGRIENVGAVKQSKDLVARMERFFAKSNELDDMIRKTEKEEEELRKHFETLVAKVQAFTAVTSTPNIKQEIASIQGELAEVEKQKTVLGQKMSKLRMLVRTVMK